MTTQQMASAMRRVADAMEKVPGGNIWKKPETQLDGSLAVGAAGILCYLRDLFTLSDREHYSRADILVILETCSRDGEIFPCGAGQLMWQAQDEPLDLEDDRNSTSDPGC